MPGVLVTYVRSFQEWEGVIWEGKNYGGHQAVEDVLAVRWMFDHVIGPKSKNA